jgi:hypothetical protein
MMISIRHQPYVTVVHKNKTKSSLLKTLLISLYAFYPQGFATYLDAS